jgi:hypothetical protein
MGTYQYRHLSTSKREIRIAHLQPGNWDDPLRVSIEHIIFEPSERDKPTCLSDKCIKQIQDDLPAAWEVCRTLEGQPLFVHCPPGGDTYTSWQFPYSSSNGQEQDHSGNHLSQAFPSGFEAVSYVWGLGGPGHDLEVVDLRSTSTLLGTISIGSGLYKMLHYLKMVDSTRVLWVDAICINQDNLTERSQQVERMRDIYLFAKSVIIWLGESSADSTTAMRTLDYVGKQLEFVSGHRFVPAPACTEKDWWNTKHSIPLSPETWDSISRFLRRPYFERLWVLQELQLANHRSIVQCGQVVRSWYNVRRALLRCRFDLRQSMQSSSSDHVKGLKHVINIARNQTTSNAGTLFGIASTRNCSNPRDKVYGLLGLLHPNLSKQIRPQYALSVADVYIQAFLATVRFTRRLDLLDRVDQQWSTRTQPSWTPNLTHASGGRYSVHASSLAAGSTAADVSYQPPDELHISGVIHGRVKAANSETTVNAISEYSSICKFISEHCPGMAEDARLESYLMIVTQSDVRERWHDHGMVPRLQELKNIVQKQSKDGKSTLIDSYKEWSIYKSTNQQRGRFFVTDGGLVGCGPFALNMGDTIAVLLGHHCPVILRPMDSRCSSGRFRILGPAHVHGLMEGQAVLGSLSPSWKLVVEHTYSTYRLLFRNAQDGAKTPQDPRLGVLPENWEPIEKEDEARLRYTVQHYRHKVTNEIINSDPRLVLEAVRARGIKVETLVLI